VNELIPPRVVNSSSPMILFSDYLCNLTFQKLFFLLLRNPFLLHGSLNEGNISPINEDSENNFNPKMKKIIQRSFIFNNQTETIATSQTCEFVTGNQPYLRKCWEL